jgi:putative protease
MIVRKKPELLAPAGDMEKLRMAVLYGADAVYLAGTSFGMRAFAGNFTPDELRNAVRFAHDHGVRVHVTVNTMPRGDELRELPAHLERLNDAGVDALIVADLGVFTLAGRYAPKCERHISTQQSVANAVCARAWYDLGAKRVVLAREVSMQEIRAIRASTPPELQIETFAHGAMCVSYSGRCLLSNYMTGRDANRGECAQPCRYQYALMEEKRPGEYFPVFEDEKGTYIMNSRDMCMIDHLDDLCDAGVECIKLEGRAKSEYYAAIVTGAYRHVLDAVWAGEPIDPAWRDEVEHVSHRHYSTGFYYGQPGQFTEDARYLREWQVVAVVEDCDADGNATLSLRNKFAAGDAVEVVGPDCRPFSMTAPTLYVDGEPCDAVRTPKTVFQMKLPRRVPPLSFVRHKVELSGR